MTFQPISGPDFDHPHYLGLFVEGFSYRLFGLVPGERHLFGAIDGYPAHFLGTDKFGRDILSRGIFGSRISLMIALVVVDHHDDRRDDASGSSPATSAAPFDAWTQRFVDLILAFPQLPLYLALTSLIPITAPTSVFLAFVVIVLSALGWAQLSREVRGKTLALVARRLRQGGGRGRRQRTAHRFPAHPAQRA